MRQRDIGIMIGLGLVVLLVAWYFLVVGPKRDSIADTQNQVQQQMHQYEQNSSRVKQLDEERAAAQQTAGELLKLNKLVPSGEDVPSLIVELQESANEAGISFMKIQPGVAAPAIGGGGTVVPLQMVFQGDYYDVNDFLYRIENYARMEGNDVNVSGRLLSVASITMSQPQSGAQFPTVSASLSVNAYMTGPPPVTGTPATGSSSSQNKTSTTAGH